MVEQDKEMRLKRFTSKEIHGYLNHDIRFFSDVNYLTGINGSGKTSVVNGITALISPSLMDLARTKFRSLSVEVIGDDEGETVISATQEDEKVFLEIAGSEAKLEIPILTDEMFEFMAPNRARDEIEAFYREHEAKNLEHPVLKSIKALPTPMVLDIERRLDRFYEKRTSVVHSSKLRRQNVFKLSLQRSLVDASELAERSYRQIKARESRLMDDFRKKLILSSIQFQDASTLFPEKFPLLNQQFFETKEEIKQTLIALGLAPEDINRSLDTFFERVNLLFDTLPPGGNVQDFIQLAVPTERKGEDIEESEEASTRKFQALLDWMVNRPQYSRLMEIKKMVDDHIVHRRRLYEPIDGYLHTVNRFLNDSGKTIEFSETSNLVVSLADGSERSITSLASGESQIVVILTHLFFNPDAKAANVFIIDEPELSLHLRWQELFVESIRTASPSLQLVLATHSPSIILDDLEHCIDLSGGSQ